MEQIKSVTFFTARSKEASNLLLECRARMMQKKRAGDYQIKVPLHEVIGEIASHWLKTKGAQNESQ